MFLMRMARLFEVVCLLQPSISSMLVFKVYHKAIMFQDAVTYSYRKSYDGIFRCAAANTGKSERERSNNKDAKGKTNFT